jgi:hypothetical protein
VSHVTECIELYVGDEAVTDEQFRAVILDALARDNVALAMNGGDPLNEIRAQLAEHAHALILLNRIDTLRAGQIRVLRQRLDSMEGKA